MQFVFLPHIDSLSVCIFGILLLLMLTANGVGDMDKMFHHISSIVDVYLSDAFYEKLRNYSCIYL